MLCRACDLLFPAVVAFRSEVRSALRGDRAGVSGSGVRAEELRRSGRRAAVSRARAGVAYLWLEWVGQSGPGAARALGVQRATLYAVARRGRPEAAYWEQLCADVKP